MGLEATRNSIEFENTKKGQSFENSALPISLSVAYLFNPSVRVVRVQPPPTAGVIGLSPTVGGQNITVSFIYWPYNRR